MLIQLNPPLELDTPKGKGLCWFFHDYGIEFDNYYTVAIHETGELWTFSNREVRAPKNITIGRLIMPKTIGASVTDKMLSKKPGKSKQKQGNLSAKPGEKLKKRVDWDANLPSSKMKKNPKR